MRSVVVRAHTSFGLAKLRSKELVYYVVEQEPQKEAPRQILGALLCIIARKFYFARFCASSSAAAALICPVVALRMASSISGTQSP